MGAMHAGIGPERSDGTGRAPREFEDLSTLFSWVVFKNTAIEAETKRNRMANETSAIKQIMPQRRKQKYHQNHQQTLIQRNQSSGYQESLKEPPTRAQSKVFYLTSTSVNHISPGTKKTFWPPEPKFADHLDQHGSTVG